jgi:glycosyltransferase involved in cell wall biosynthesis
VIKVLGLSLYGQLAASTRYRLGQYVPGLASVGIDLQIFHLLGDDYLRERFRGDTISWSGVFRSSLARLGDLWRQRDYDLVLLHCELFPLMPGWLETTLLRKPYIYDYDDAFYLKYREGHFGLMKSFLGSKFDTVIGGAAAVTAGNHVLAQYAKQFNVNTQYLPTVVDTERYRPMPERRGGTIYTIGWIGSPSTAMYLSQIVGPLSTIGREGPVRFIVIGGNAPQIPNVEVISVEWNERIEIDFINSFDVGVMPLTDDEWARGKCAFKLIQYMACAVPVIASPVGANIGLISGQCGFLASNPTEWIDLLRILRDEPKTRALIGLAGRDRVLQSYSLNQHLAVLASVIRQASSIEGDAK